MSMQDPIADMLTRIRNAQMVGEKDVNIPFSTLKLAILNVLKDEGYVSDFQPDDINSRKSIKVGLKYYQGNPVIDKLKRVSRPGLRIYRRHDQLPTVLGGMGIAIISTPQGVMTEKSARAKKVGGEVLCTVE